MRNIPSFTTIDYDPFEDGKDIEKIIFTNDSQREIWLSCMIGGEEANLAYNESVSLEFDGALNFDAFKKAIDNVVLRHEALRSTISPNGEMLVVYKDSPIQFDLVDLAELVETAQQQQLDSFLKKELDIPFDLQNGPLLKVFLHKLTENKYFFTLIKHHIICDGWSTGVILEDISKMYNSYTKGADILINKPAQISDYAVLQQQFRLTDEYRSTEKYWLSLYREHIPIVDLPTDFERSFPRTFKGDRIDHILSKSLIEQVKSIGAKAGASLVTTLLSAFEIFLYQETHQTDLVVGVPSSGQASSGLTDLVGHCVNLLPIKSAVDPQLSFNEYLKKRKREILDAYDHQRLTFGELIKKLYITRDSSRVTLVPVAFNIDMGMDQAVFFDDLRHRLITNPRAYQNFELFLNVTGSKDQVVLEWAYNAGLFNKDTINEFHYSYENILKDIIKNPDSQISELSQWHAHDNELNHNTLIEPAYSTLKDLIDEAAIKYPERIAVSFNDVSITYAELDTKANQLAHFLINQGLKSGDVAAIALDRSAEMITVLFAVIKTGATYLAFDTNHPKERIDYMLDDAAASLLITSKKYADYYSSEIAEIYLEDFIIQSAALNFTTPGVKISPEDLVYILYTSGSTGKPKGVKIRHRNVVNFLFGMTLSPGIQQEDRLLAITPLSFDMAVLLYLPLTCGAELVVADLESSKDGRMIYDVIKTKKISWMIATPSTWRMIINSGWQEPLQLSAISGGEAMPKDLAKDLLDRCSSVWNAYGPTETTVIVLVKEIKSANGPITLGRPIVNTQIYILDEYGNQVSRGTQGELYISGNSVGAGYHNLDELTGMSFIPDPFSIIENTMMYKTGDFGKLLPSGEIQYLGRMDDQVKIRGYRIELGEIEQTLSTYKDIEAAVVNPYGLSPQDTRLIAYVKTNKKLDDEDSSVAIQAWENYLKGLLPEYMVPHDYVIVDTFPITENGKIDRKTLALLRPDNKNPSEHKIIGPRNATEKMLMQIWMTSLDVKELSITDDFFKSGGHSLIAVKIMVAIEKETGKRFPLASFFENSNIEKFAKLIESGEEKIKWDCLVPIKTSGNKIPIYLIHGGGLNVLTFNPMTNYMDYDQPVYALQALGLNGNYEINYTLEEISAKYVEEIISNNPVGPYAIAGYSLGGMIAYEIARQLKTMGKEIALLGILDTNSLGRTLSDKSWSKKIIRQFHKLIFFSKQFVKRPAKTIDYQFLVLTLKAKEIFFKKRETQVVKNDINKSYDIAYNNYVLKPMDVKVDLFRVTDRIYYLDDPIYLGWNLYAKNGVEIHPIPGDHKTFLSAPNDKIFAQILQSRLNRLNKNEH